MKSMGLYSFLDYFFMVFHLVIVLFNLFGWIWKPTRKANLILLLLTGASWFGLGIFYGWGYCPFTDWHWKVLHRLGEWPAENSYIQYLLIRVFNLKVGADLVDAAILLFYLSALVASVFVNWRNWKQGKRIYGKRGTNQPENRVG
jgi:hypothetical protein